MVPETDGAVNPLGIKGIGEIGIVGVNAAVANAVHHATGRRVRSLPIRVEDLFGQRRPTAGKAGHRNSSRVPPGTAIAADR